MDKKQKQTLIYVITASIISLIIIISLNPSISKMFITDEVVMKSSFDRTLNINTQTLFVIMANVEDYPKILPHNVISVKVLNKTNNIIFAEEEVTERGLTTKLLVKHTIFPYEKHIIEIMNGEVENTIITETFEDKESYTILTTDVEMHLRGIMIYFANMSQENMNHALDTVITSFVEYAKNKEK